MSKPLELRPYQQAGLEHILTPLKLSGKPHKALLICPGGGKTPIIAAGIKKLNALSSLTLCLANILIKEHHQKHLVDWGGIKLNDTFIVETGNDVIPDNAKHIIVNYDLLQNKDVFDQIMRRPKYAVLNADEAQRLKNFSSLTSNSVLGGRTTGKPRIMDRCFFKWYSSGTLSPNSRPMEVFPLIKTNYPEAIPDHLDFDAFGQYFCNGFVESFGGWNYNGISNLEEFSGRIQDFVYTVRPDQIKDQLPDLIETNHYIPVPQMLMNLSNTHMETLRREVGMAKMPEILNYLRIRLATGEGGKGEKLTIIAYNRLVIDTMLEGLKQYNMRVVYGGISDHEKKQQIQDFINDPSVGGIILQIKSGGVSFDGMQHICNNVVSVQEDWCPGDWDQVIGRIRRFGQKFPVNFTRLIAKATMDVNQYDRVNTKRIVSEIMFPTTQAVHTGVIEMALEEEVAKLTQAVLSIGEILKGVVANASQEGSKPAGPKGGKGAKGNQTPPPAQSSTPDVIAPQPGNPAPQVAPAPASSGEPTQASLKAQAKEILDTLHPDGQTTQESRDRINAITFKYQHPPVQTIQQARIDGVPVQSFPSVKAEFDTLLAQVKTEKSGVSAPPAQDDFGV